MFKKKKKKCKKSSGKPSLKKMCGLSQAELNNLVSCVHKNDNFIGVIKTVIKKC